MSGYTLTCRLVIIYILIVELKIVTFYDIKILDSDNSRLSVVHSLIYLLCDTCIFHY